MKNINKQTYCAKCGSAFNCVSENIKECFCNSLLLSRATLDHIKTNYKGCLCKNCLVEISTLTASIRSILITLLLFIITNGFAQFHGAVGSLNTTAMHKDSSAFINWANTCTVSRGWQNIADHSLGKTDAGLDEYGIGKAGDNPVVSLGDGGYAILTFPQPITNGTGFDFAVFENSFSDHFLELAFVEVSSDGINFFRFPCTSLTSCTSQIGPFDHTGEASLVNNLAGKYRVLYGTPFDLDELKNISGLDIDRITHVKIIDVVGSIQSTYASLDRFGNPINDPYPTDFGNGGFDLDAVGVIHQKSVGIKEDQIENGLTFYPNPATEQITIYTGANKCYYKVIDQNGEIKMEGKFDKTMLLKIDALKNGVYFIETHSDQKHAVKKIIVQHN
jgi:hypothetical protein